MSASRISSTVKPDSGTDVKADKTRYIVGFYIYIYIYRSRVQRSSTITRGRRFDTRVREDTNFFDAYRGTFLRIIIIIPD